MVKKNANGVSGGVASEDALADHETPILKRKRLLYSVGFPIVLMYFSPMGHMDVELAGCLHSWMETM